MINKGKATAISLREQIGMSSPNDIPIEDVVIGRGAILIEESMGKADGRIVYGKNLSTIFINSDIKHAGRRQFAIAHELGHLEMHKGLPIHDDRNNLDWFNDTEKQLKEGIQEYEANQFAVEYLMPMEMFKAEAKNQKLSPLLLKQLSEKFLTSITSVAFRYLEANIRPMILFHIFDGKVRYWKKSSDLYVTIPDITKLAPPSDSVASEYIEKDYKPIYRESELQQEIDKSTWFTLNKYDKDSLFYEYCIVHQGNKSILSVVWED